MKVTKDGMRRAIGGIKALPQQREGYEDLERVGGEVARVGEEGR